MASLLGWVDPAVITKARAEGVALGPTTHGVWQVGVMALKTDGGRSELLMMVHIPVSGEPSPQVRQWLGLYPRTIQPLRILLGYYEYAPVWHREMSHKLNQSLLLCSSHA